MTSQKDGGGILRMFLYVLQNIYTLVCLNKDNNYSPYIFIFLLLSHFFTRECLTAWLLYTNLQIIMYVALQKNLNYVNYTYHNIIAADLNIAFAR